MFTQQSGSGQKRTLNAKVTGKARSALSSRRRSLTALLGGIDNLAN